MEYVNRRETGESKNERPFYAKQKVATIRKYTDVWLKILRYIWRTSERDSKKRPKWVFTPAQRVNLRSIKRVAREVADEEEREGEGNEVGGQHDQGVRRRERKERR